jgi:rhomboid protease GluP
MQFAGEHDRGQHALSRAVALSERDARGRALAEERLKAPPRAPVILSPELEELAARVALASSTAAPVQAPAQRGTRATYALIAANVAAHLVVTLVLGSTQDPWVLARAGANLKAVVAEEPWRLLASAFLHVGGLHLAVNMLSLWSLGRFVEPAFGALRFTVVYFVAALAGSLASVVFGGPGMSAGASGAVFGLLGAAIAELAVVRRQAAAGAWRRAVLGNLIFVAVANLAIGALYPMIDQAAHVGGLVGGAACALLFSPGWRVGGSRVVRVAAPLLFGLFAAATVAAAAAVVATSAGETREHLGWRRHTMGALSLELPAAWEVSSEGTASDPLVNLNPTFTVETVDADQAAGVLGGAAAELDEMEAISAVRQLPTAAVLPAGWTGGELAFTYRDAAGERSDYRKALFVAAPEWLRGGRVVIVSLLVPEARRDEIAAVAPRILASLRRGP